MRSSSLNLSDGRSLDAYIDDVEGTPLVFHFGTPSSGLPMDDHVDLARERGLRWISWSRPGYGSSTRNPGRTVVDVVADTREVMDQLGADRAYLAGWSGGGPHALACAALIPERVIGVSTIASVAPWGAEGLDFLDGMGAENIEEFGAALEGEEALVGFKERVWPVFRNVTAEEIGEAFGDLVDDVDRGALTGEFAGAAAANIREGLRDGYYGWLDDDLAFVRNWGFDLLSIDVPVHIWQGAHDRMVPFAHGQWLAANCGGACVHLRPEHGHVSLVAAFGEILDEMVSGQ